MRTAAPATRLAVLLLALEVVAVASDLWLGQAGQVSTEERFNAQAAAHLACGHIDAMLDLRYRAFCGGCTAEALAAAPLYRLLGPTVLAWKLVPAALHLVTAISGTVLARRIAGPRGAAAFAALILGAPAAWRQLALTGFGNHTEAMALVLGASALLATAEVAKGRVATAALQLGSGLLAGLAAWFSYSAAGAAVAAVLVGLWSWRRGGLTVLAGVGLGLVPLIWHGLIRPEELARAQVTWAGPVIASPSELLGWFFGDFLVASLWPQPVPQLLTIAACLLLLALASAGAIRAWRSGTAGRYLLLTLAAFVVATGLRHDLWADNPAVVGFDPFNLRYRIPWIVMLSVFAAAAVGPTPRGRRSTVGVLALAALGVVLRISAWTVTPADLGAEVLLPGFHFDATVPEAEPARRVPRLMARPQDVEAASDFLLGHDDPLPACRADHAAELGRRAALALAQDHDEMVLRVLSGVPEDDLPALAAGLRRGADQAQIATQVLEQRLSPSPRLQAAVARP